MHKTQTFNYTKIRVDLQITLLTCYAFEPKVTNSVLKTLSTEDAKELINLFGRIKESANGLFGDLFSKKYKITRLLQKGTDFLLDGRIKRFITTTFDVNAEHQITVNIGPSKRGMNIRHIAK